mgnify:FL=1
MRPKPRTPESNDVFRQLAQVPQHLKPKVTDLLQKVERLLKQQPQDSHKLYSLHAPEVECISKGKLRQPYEFGVKVSVMTTHKEGLVVGMRSLPGNPYDGHTLLTPGFGAGGSPDAAAT